MGQPLQFRLVDNPTSDNYGVLVIVVEPSSPPLGQALGACGDGLITLVAANPTGCLSEPVNTATGSYHAIKKDLHVRGFGLDFDLVRAYSSVDSTVGPLGPGWTHSYNISLAVQSNGDVVLRGGDGQKLYFTKRENGSFIGDPGSRTTLTSVTGGYEALLWDRTKYIFSTSGFLQKIRDRNGKELTISPDAQTRIDYIDDTVGRRIDFAYHPVSGRLTSVTLPAPDSRTVAYTYDVSSRLSQVTDTRGKLTKYSYDSSNRLTEILVQKDDLDVPPTKLVIRNEYSTTTGRVIKQWVPSSVQGQADLLTTFGWDSATQTATMTTTRGGQQYVWKDIYEGYVLTRREDPLGNATVYTRDENYWPATIAFDPVTGATRTWTYDYDDLGNMLSETPPPVGQTQYAAETFVYDASKNVLTQHTDRRGAVTTLTYDTAGNLELMTLPDPDGAGPKTSPVWDIIRDVNNPARVTGIEDPRDKTWAFQYNDAANPGIPTAIVSPLSKKTSFVYDTASRMTQLVEARGNETGATPDDYRWRFEYNAADQQTKITDPLGFGAGYFTEFTYDPIGLLTKTHEAKGGNATQENVVSYEYNPRSLLKVVKHLNSTGQAVSETSYEYDEVGNLTARIDGLSRRTEYLYDGANRLTQAKFVPTAQTWNLTWNGYGDVTTVETPRGAATGTAGDYTITYGYDELRRLNAINYSDDTPDVTYSYDANDNRTGMVDGLGTVSYVYDALDRLTSADRADADATWETGAFTYDYFADGRIKQRDYPEGEDPIDYTYTDEGRLNTVAVGTLTTSYTYDAAGHLATTALPNGVVDTWTIDRAGRVTRTNAKKNTTTLTDVTYTTLDEIGNPLRIDTPSEVNTLTYDAMQRLDTVCFSASCPLIKDIDYSYDAVGNRLTEVRPAGTTTYNYRVAGGQQTDELSSIVGPGGTANYTYDKNGNVTQAGGRTFSWDLANRLSVTAAGDALTTTQLWYQYDGDGKRVSFAKDTSINGNQARTGIPCLPSCDEITYYNWDVNASIPQLALETNGLSPYTAKRRYVFGHDTHQMRSGASAEYYYATDRLGSVLNLSDSTGAAVWSYTYEPFGKLRSETQHGIAQPLNLLRYTGELWDNDSSLYHLRARQYDSNSGRFLALDPIPPHVADPYSARYLYALNRPSMLTDPTGEFPALIALPWVIGGAVVIVGGFLAADAASDALVGAYENWSPPDDTYTDRNRTTDEGLGGSSLNCRTWKCKLAVGGAAGAIGTAALCAALQDPDEGPEDTVNTCVPQK